MSDIERSELLERRSGASAPGNRHHHGGDGATGSLVRAAQILRAVAAGGRAGSSLSELVSRTGLPRPTIHRVCQMLEDLAWLERAEIDKRFHLGREMAVLGLTAQLQHPIETIAHPVLAELSRETGQTFYLLQRSGDDAVCVARCESQSQIRTLVLEVGSRQPLGVGAGSMAILAALPSDEIARVIEGNRHRYQERQAFDEKTFRESMRLARERHYASHEGLFTRGVSGIGVAVLDRSGYPFAAISTAFITEGLDAEQRRRCATRMKAAAEDMGIRLTMRSRTDEIHGYRK